MANRFRRDVTHGIVVMPAAIALWILWVPAQQPPAETPTDMAVVADAPTGWLAGLAVVASTEGPVQRSSATWTIQEIGGSPGPFADTCGETAPSDDPPLADWPIFPEGEFPIELPDASFLGAPNIGPNPYEEGVHWGRLPEGRVWGSSLGIDVAPDGTIWVTERCGSPAFADGGTPCLDNPVDPVLQFDREGRLLSSFGAGMLVRPHKLEVDHEGFIWVTDFTRSGESRGLGHTVHKFTPEGELLMTLGTPGETGDGGPDYLEHPNDVAVAPNGDIYVADGHGTGAGVRGNARVVKFDRDGNFITAWGQKGMKPGEFDMPHAIDLDSRGWVYVADRINNRVQVFEPDGTLAHVWYQFGRPSALYIDQDDVLYVSDTESRDGRSNTGRPRISGTGYGFNPATRRGIRIGSARTGEVEYFAPSPCPYPYPGVSGAEGLAVDEDGNIYGAEWLGTVRKYVRR